MARLKMQEKFGEVAYTKGFDVFTTIDSKLQKSAQTALKNSIEQYDIRHGYRGAEAKINYNELLNANFEHDLDTSMKKYRQLFKRFL